MKISMTVLSLAFASANGSSLRSVVSNNMNAYNNNNNGKILESEVILKGTIGEPTAEDMDFIGKALVASYNNVHWEAGHFMTGDHSVDFSGPDSFLCHLCPDDDSMGGAVGDATSVFEVKTPVGFLCHLCPDDDAMGADSLLMTAVTNDCGGLCQKDAVAALEVSFCNKIRGGSSEYLSSAKSCAIRFDAHEEKKKSSKVATPVASASTSSSTVATIDSTIILKGVGAGDATQEEKAILAKAFVSAYNDVHWGTNHYLKDAQIPFAAATNPDGFLCHLCPDDDSMGSVANAKQTNTLVFDLVTPVEAFLCHLCPDDDSMGSQFDLQTLNSSNFDKKAVEVAFCNKIQNSVSDKLSATKTCSIAVESIIAASTKAKAW